MNLAALSDANLQEPSGLQQFVDLNAIDHEVFYAALMEQKQIAIDHHPLSMQGEINQDWLAMHDTEHRAIAAALSLAVPPDLGFLDVKDVAVADDWRNNHANAHQRIIEALGL